MTSRVSDAPNMLLNFEKDDAVKEPFAKLAEQVEHVFGRPLTT